MGILDFDISKITGNDAFQLGMGILGNNSGHYGALGPALGGGLQDYQRQKYLQQENLYKQAQMEQQKRQWEQQQAEYERLKNQQDADYKITGGMSNELWMHQNPTKDQRSALEKQLISAGFIPGTDAYKNALLMGISNGLYMGDMQTTPQAQPFGYQDPSRHIRDPKERDKLKSKLAEQAVKSLEAEGANLNTYRDNMDKMRRFSTLSKTNETGGATSLPGLSWARSKVDPEYGEMSSIASGLIPQMRQGLPGAASDRDVQMFANATVSVENPNETNDAIAQAYIAAQQNLIDRQEFRQAYFDSTGTLSGADAAWQRYLNDNGIFDYNANGYKLNENRMDWKTYFGMNSGSDFETLWNK